MRLRLKLFLPLIAFLLVFTSYAQWYWFPRLTSSVKAQHAIELQNHLKSVGESLIPLLLQAQLANIHDTLDSLMEANPSWKQIQLKNKFGQTLYPISPKSFDTFGENRIMLYQKITLVDREIAGLGLVVDISSNLKKIEKLERNFFSLLLLLLILMVFSIAILLEWIVSRPIRRLSLVSEKLSEGDYDAKLPIAHEDEVGHLVKRFDLMRQALKQYRYQVEEEIIGHKQTTRELVNQKERLAYYATHDSLTGLYNRREFETRLYAAIDRARKDVTEHTIFYIDLDRFKLVNDSCGHLGGDLLLKQISNLIKNHVRGSDTVARLGGDEFAVLLEYCPADIAKNTVIQLNKSIKKFIFRWQDKTFSVGASIGVSFITENTPGIESILQAVDGACYTAKRQGKNRYHIDKSGEEAIDFSEQKVESVAYLLDALHEDKFVLYVQPFQALDPQADSRLHYEILIRMLGDQETNLVLPSKFIPSAERYNLMAKIDQWVITSAFKSLQKIAAFSQKTVALSINLSGISMSDMELLTFINQQLKIYSINAKNICFEITETTAISDISNAKMLINELKKIGCEFALDDFGSGFSSLAYLKNLPIDYLKIDGEFIREIADDPISEAMVQSIHQIARVLGMKTIAEFVENDVIRKKIEKIGVDYIQGNGIAEPFPISELLDPDNINSCLK